MSTPKFNSKSPTIRRILREAAELSSSPSPDYTATPLESDLFEWHFTFRGPPNSVYSEGIYHGRIVLPPTYPLRPPSFRFMTPSGRFEANREICLSISGHHEETWQPAWGVRTALVALRSFMETDPKGQLGGLDSSDSVRRRHASDSQSYRCPACAKSNQEIMQECEDNAKAASDSAAAAKEVEIPAELSMTWKDQMVKPAEGTGTVSDGSPSNHVGTGDDEIAELAEGFVSTNPVADLSESRASTTYPPARPAQALPAPTRTAVLLPRQQVAPHNPNAPEVQRQQDEGVPLWVDRGIVVLVVLLAAMIIKVLLEF